MSAKKGSVEMLWVPGIGPICAMAMQAFAPPAEAFKNGRDFAAWLGMVPRQNSTGGKQKLGKTSKMGQRDIRRLLIIGATSVVKSAKRKGTRSTWLARMLACKPPMLVATALANKMARMVWALMTKQEDYRDPAAAA
jgi:transposase